MHPVLLTPVLRIIHRAIHTHLIKHTHSKRNDTNSGAIDPDNALALLQAASTSYRIAAGPRARRKVLTLAGGIVGCGERSEPHRSRDALCVNAMGFSLHAGMHCEADDRHGIEQLANYNMAALAQARVRSGGFYAARGAGFEG